MSDNDEAEGISVTIRMIGEGVMVDAAATPHAHHTAWAIDPNDGCYILVLEDEHDKPIAFAGYTFKSWLAVFRALCSFEEEERWKRTDIMGSGKHV